MPDSTPRRRRRQIETLRAQFAQADGPAFADVLPADRVEAALREEGACWRHKVYTPLVTLWAFLTQVASQPPRLRNQRGHAVVGRAAAPHGPAIAAPVSGREAEAAAGPRGGVDPPATAGWKSTGS